MLPHLTQDTVASVLLFSMAKRVHAEELFSTVAYIQREKSIKLGVVTLPVNKFFSLYVEAFLETYGLLAYYAFVLSFPEPSELVLIQRNVKESATATIIALGS